MYISFFFALPPTPTPDASQWNIGGIGSSGVGHVYFMYISCIFHVLCASFSLTQRQIPVEYGLYNAISRWESLQFSARLVGDTLRWVYLQ